MRPVKQAMEVLKVNMAGANRGATSNGTNWNAFSPYPVIWGKDFIRIKT